ncbi:MAG: Cell shape-determining protein [Pelotomaculum thermopropionicum]|uniref:Cell shape-determining protein n=1 Tax=Pelotomaculum thermopropionicum TaxID=110500 RepID=A0A101HTP6_9FIRM|nr:MAG: Cell shape-determining protein [Pelotomaculum thermopropionicum]
MPIPVFLLLLGVALLLQTTILEQVAVIGVKPDLVMLLTILNSFLLGTREGAFLGFAGGIIEDLFAGSYVGLNALSNMAAGYLAGAVGVRLNREHTPVAVGVTFVSAMVGLIVHYLLSLFLGIYIPVFFALFRVAFPTAFYTALLVPLFFKRLLHFTQVYRREL